MENEATQSGVESTNEIVSQSDVDADLLSAYLSGEDNYDGNTNDVDSNESAIIDTPIVDKFSVKINGIEKEVSRDELISNYQKSLASDQRLEEASQIKREVEQERRNFQQNQAQLQQAITHFQTVAQQWANQAQPDWNSLLENNPHEYLRQKELYQAREHEMRNAQAAQAYLQQEQHQRQEQFEMSRLATEGEKLLNILPEWKDQKARERDETNLVKHLMERGYTQEDIAGLNRSRAENIAIAMDAMRYRQLVSQAKTVSKKVEGLPPRIERPGVAPVNTSAKEEAMKRLNRSGSITDAAAAMAHLFSS